jgi:hypothetical protein
MKCIAFEQVNGVFTLKTEKGKLKREEPELSYLKHNFMCFGRADKQLIAEPANRRGWSGEATLNSPEFSKAWVYFKEGSIKSSAMNGIVNEFNNACNRDFKRGLFPRKITINEIIKLEKNNLLIKVLIGNQPTQLRISI